MNATEPSWQELAAQSVALINCAANATYPRGLGFEMPTKGAFGPLAWARRAVDLGFKKIMLHNYWGRNVTKKGRDYGAMTWDQRPELLHEAKRDPKLLLVDDFSPWFSFLEEFPEIELIWYLGACHDGRDVTNITMVNLEYDPVLYYERWFQSVAKIVELHHSFPGRASVIGDSGWDVGASELHFHGLAMLRAMGLRVGVEPSPMKGLVGLYDFDHLSGWRVNSEGVAYDPFEGAAVREDYKLLTGRRIAQLPREGLTKKNMAYVLGTGSIPAVLIVQWSEIVKGETK